MSRGRRQRRAGRGRTTAHAEPGTAELVGRRALWGSGGARDPRVNARAHWAPARRRGGAPPWADGSGKGPGMRGHPPGAGATVPGSASEPVAAGTLRGPGGGAAMRAVSVEGGAPTPGPSPASLRPRSPGSLPLHRQKRGPGAPWAAAMRPALGAGGGGRGGSDSGCVVKVVFLTGGLWGVRGEPRAFSRAR